MLGAPPAREPASSPASGESCLHVPSTVTSTQYWGAVAASSRRNTAFDDTPTVGLPGTGITQAKFRDGPAYSIWNIAVIVESGLSTSRIFSADGRTGAVREDQRSSCA